MNERSTHNILDKAITDARAGTLPMNAFVRLLVESDLALPSAQIVRANGSGFEPLFFDKEGTGMLVAFSDKTHALQYTQVAPYCLVMKGEDVLRQLPHQYGLVINPGREVGFDISPEGIRKILNDIF